MPTTVLTHAEFRFTLIYLTHYSLQKTRIQLICTPATPTRVNTFQQNPAKSSSPCRYLINSFCHNNDVSVYPRIQSYIHLLHNIVQNSNK